jgi:hypothetical protein
MTDFGGLVADINRSGNGAAAQTHDDWIRKELLPTIAQFVESRVKPLRERIEELEGKQKHWTYRGVYQSGETYHEGNFATSDGSLFACRCDTITKPGTDETRTLCCNAERTRDDRRRSHGKGYRRA